MAAGRCPACGAPVELADTCDNFPPGPMLNWPPRWRVVHDGRTIHTCPGCGEHLDATQVAEHAGYEPDYPVAA